MESLGNQRTNYNHPPRKSQAGLAVKTGVVLGLIGGKTYLTDAALKTVSSDEYKESIKTKAEQQEKIIKGLPQKIKSYLSSNLKEMDQLFGYEKGKTGIYAKIRELGSKAFKFSTDKKADAAKWLEKDAAASKTITSGLSKTSGIAKSIGKWALRLPGPVKLLGGIAVGLTSLKYIYDSGKISGKNHHRKD